MRFSGFLAMTMLLLISGCSIQRVFDPLPPVPGSEPASDATPVPGVADTPAVATPVPSPQPAPRRVAVLLSDDIEAYQATAAQIEQRGAANRLRTFNLDGRAELSTELVAQIEAFAPDQIVAVGLLAARAAKQFSDVPMVFCQVFNYADHDLLSASTTGVQLLPPFDLQLTTWKVLSPGLRTVGLIVGPNREDLVTEAREAAALHGIELMSRSVTSDKEMLYVFRRLAPELDGFWLLPDNRVLSPRVLREIVAYGNKHDTQTVVFNDGLLSLGAFMSVTSDPGDVADAVLARLDEQEAKTASRPGMRPLTVMRVEVGSRFSDRAQALASPALAPFLAP